MAHSSRDDTVGLSCSLAAHAGLVLVLYLGNAFQFDSFKDPVIYSVTMEGGKELGGKTQAPDPKAKTQIAPPKNVQEPETQKKEEKKTETKEEEKKITPKEVEDAEVSLQEKKKEEERLKKEEEAKKKEEEAKKKKEEEQKKKDEEKKKLEEKKKKAAEERKAVDKNLQQAMQRYLGESANAGGKTFGAARLGGTGMGGGVVRPPEFFTYLKILEEHIKSGWRWNDTSAALVAQVQIEIEPDGTVRDVILRKGSGNSLYDDSIIRAVRKASPVPTPPVTVYQYFKSVLLTFDPRQ